MVAYTYVTGPRSCVIVRTMVEF